MSSGGAYLSFSNDLVASTRARRATDFFPSHSACRVSISDNTWSGDGTSATPATCAPTVTANTTRHRRAKCGRQGKCGRCAPAAARPSSGGCPPCVAGRGPSQSVWTGQRSTCNRMVQWHGAIAWCNRMVQSVSAPGGRVSTVVRGGRDEQQRAAPKPPGSGHRLVPRLVQRDQLEHVHPDLHTDTTVSEQ